MSLNLAISNIAWSSIDKLKVYKLLQEIGISAIECAPSLLVESKNPYDNIERAYFEKEIALQYGLKIVSIQSITFGYENLNLFKSKKNRNNFINHMFNVVDFASVLGAKSIVFGSPKNRFIPDYIKEDYKKIAIDFFNEVGNYAYSKNCLINIEPNPVIYQTNFINTHIEAIMLLNDCNSKGLSMNFDTGTILENKENIIIDDSIVKSIGHVHISEPQLNPIELRSEFHSRIISDLKSFNYDGYVSVEMRNTGKDDNIVVLSEILKYLKKIVDNE